MRQQLPCAYSNCGVLLRYVHHEIKLMVIVETVQGYIVGQTTYAQMALFSRWIYVCVDIPSPVSLPSYPTITRIILLF